MIYPWIDKHTSSLKINKGQIGEAPKDRPFKT